MKPYRYILLSPFVFLLGLGALPFVFVARHALHAAHALADERGDAEAAAKIRLWRHKLNV